MKAGLVPTMFFFQTRQTKKEIIMEAKLGHNNSAGLFIRLCVLCGAISEEETRAAGMGSCLRFFIYIFGSSWHV